MSLKVPPAFSKEFKSGTEMNNKNEAVSKLKTKRVIARTTVHHLRRSSKSHHAAKKQRWQNEYINRVIDALAELTGKRRKSALTEIAGLLVLTRILHILLVTFHEWRFNQKMKKETNEEFRDIFTYSNFKRTIVENLEMKV